MSKYQSIKVSRDGVSVINLHKAYKVNAPLVRKVAGLVFRRCGKFNPARLGFVFLNNRQIRALNKRHKGEDRSTDVLSFDLGGNGEIFISIDKALANSKIFKTSLNEEFVLYIIHGILHLSGYDDENRKDRARMEAQQHKILEEICRKEDLSKVLTPR